MVKRKKSLGVTFEFKELAKYTFPGVFQPNGIQKSGAEDSRKKSILKIGQKLAEFRYFFHRAFAHTIFTATIAPVNVLEIGKLDASVY